MIAVSVSSMTSAAGVEAGLVRARADVVDEMVAVELAGGDVDRHVHVALGELPLLRLAARLLDDPAADVDDELRLLEERDERVGLHDAAHRVVPAQQRLDAEHAPVSSSKIGW